MLERVDRNDHHQQDFTQDQSDRLAQPVRPVRAEITRQPRTSSSGGIPSELEELGLSCGRQGIQDALKRRRDEQKIAKRLEKLGFENLSKENNFGSIVVRKPSIGRDLYIYRPGRTYPFQIGLQKDS